LEARANYWVTKIGHLQGKKDNKHMAKYSAELLSKYNIKVSELQSLGKDCVLWNPASLNMLGAPPDINLGELITKWY
jgi:hypothetical protein